MSKKQFRSQASSGRAFGASAFGGGSGTSGFGGFGFGSSSPLSYITEPPDLSGISDPNVGVAFKNLSKKDSTTKAKALEDLQAHVTLPNQEVEEALLEAWVKLYPRLSIDSARRVRQLSHLVLGHIAPKCGKRIARHMPKLAAPWLAGAQDNDRAVSKAAQDALNQVFITQEKLHNVARAFQQPILDYCRDAILNETVQTLSDERNVSADDAEATYSRVVATSLAVISNLLRDLAPEDTAKQQDTYAAVLSESKIWDFAAYKDVAVRRYVHRLLRICLNKQKDLIQTNLQTISGAYVGKALHSDQTGCANELMQTLVDLTTAFPQVWTTSYSGKKPASQRLRQCLKRGSQAGSANFWSSAWALLSKLPHEVLPKNFDEAKELLAAVHDGLNLREERFNASASWETYFKLADLVQTTASLSSDDSEMLVKEMLLPVIEQYLHPVQQNSQWAVTGAHAASTVAKAAHSQIFLSVLEQNWQDYAAILMQAIKTLQPEKSKDFEKSQTSVAAAGERWARLQSELVRGDYKLPSSLKEAFTQSSKSIIQASLELLKSRNGKPYGAAAVVNELMAHSSEVILSDDEGRRMVTAFILNDMSSLLYTPSQRQLLSLLFQFEKDSQFETAFSSVADSLGEAEDSSEKLSAFRNMLAYPRAKSVADLASKNGKIQSFLQDQYQSSMDSGEQWRFLADSMRDGPSIASPSTSFDILVDLTASLSISDKANSSLNGLDEIARGNRPLMKDFIARSEGSQLLPSLLLLQESADDTLAHKAAEVSKHIVTNDANKYASQVILFDVVHQHLRDTSPDSLPMHTILEMSAKLVSELDLNRKEAETAKQAMPSLEVWRAALAPFLNRAPLPSLAVTSLLGGAVNLVSKRDSEQPKIARDAEGYSQALRIAMYTARVYSNHAILEALDQSLRSELFEMYYLTLILATESVNITSPNGLLSAPSPDTELEILEYLNEANRFAGHCFEQYDDASSSSGYSFVGSAIDALFKHSHGSEPVAFHNAQALGHALGDIQSTHGQSHGKVQEYMEKLPQLYKDRCVLPFVACVRALNDLLSDSKKLDRSINELVSDLTGSDVSQASIKVLEQLCMLNALLAGPREAGTFVAKQRLVFLMKHILPWLQMSDVPRETKEQVCTCLTLFLGSIGDIYGEHWSEMLDSIVEVWKTGFIDQAKGRIDESRMILVNSTLHLAIVLRKLTVGEDPNDDLIDSWKDHEDDGYAGLMNVLKQGHEISDEYHRPMKATFELLAEEIAKWSKTEVKDATELYPLLHTPSRALQKTAFYILHSAIPAAQEQISFDAALENKAAQLPEELLSLVLEAPNLSDIVDASFQNSMPQELQGYLFSWQLIFDHFTNASYKVKSDYVENLKEGDYLPALLDLVFVLLGHARGRPVDVSKLPITRYDYTGQEDDLNDTEMSAEKRMQWLLTHLYYLCLTHLPSLTKAHFLSMNSRQTSLAVESWTAKYIAPLIINASLTSVAEWSANSAKDDPDFENLTVKVGMRSREVNVSYLVDEQTMAIVVRLPETYPLTGARVEGVSRVAVDEKRWLSWLRNCQGVITFSNGNLIDGLSAWRKNVTGALKGQTECAICYSIISGDKQLPSKRCGTCKNLFHSSCLFKWFKTSNASSCPLCRNAFNYG